MPITQPKTDRVPLIRWYVTFFEHTWGRGRTADEAKANARKAGATGQRWYTKMLPYGAGRPTVDGLGNISWTWVEGFEPEPGPTHCAIVAAGRAAPKEIRSSVVEDEGAEFVKGD